MHGPPGALTAAERHEVAVLALPHVVAFELGLPHRFLGGAVDADGRPLYRVRTCTVDGGPVRTSAGYAVLPEHDASILRTAAHGRRPGHRRRAADRRGPARPAPSPPRCASRRPDARLVSICTGAYVLARRRPCSTADRPPRTGCAPSRSAPSSRRCGSTRTCSTSTTATCSPPPATPPGSTCCLHVVRRDHGAEVANRVARRNVVAPWRDGGQSQFSAAAAGRPAPAPTTPGARHRRHPRVRPRPPRRAAAPGPAGRARGDERAHVHPPLPRRDRAEPAHLARRAAGRARPAPAGDHRPAGRAGRRRRRVRHRRLAAPAPAHRDRRLPRRVPADVPGATTVDDPTFRLGH